MDRSLGNEEVAVDGFQEAVNLLESLKLKSEDTGLEQRVRVPLPCHIKVWILRK